MKRDKCKKICFIMPDKFPVPAVCGGAIETLITNLINENENDPQFDITIFSVYSRAARKEVLNRSYKYTNFVWTMRNVSISRMINIIYSFWLKIFKNHLYLFRKHYGKIFRYLKKNTFDYYIVEAGDIEYVNAMVGKLNCKNVILHIHHHDRPIITEKFNFHYIMGVSEFVTNEYIKLLEKKIKGYTLKNCIDISQFKRLVTDKDKFELKKKLNLYEDDFIVVFVGRIIKEKGVKQLLNSILSIKNEKIKLLIIGSTNFSSEKVSSYEKEIFEIAKKNSERIIMTGYVKNCDIYKYLKISNVQCIPSMWEEAAGLVLLEAMAVGLPTVITQSGGMVEYANQGASVLVSRCGIESNLSEAIMYLYQNQKECKKMSQTAIEHVKKYDSKFYLNNLCSILFDIEKRDSNEDRNIDIS